MEVKKKRVRIILVIVDCLIRMHLHFSKILDNKAIHYLEVREYKRKVRLNQQEVHIKWVMAQDLEVNNQSQEV